MDGIQVRWRNFRSFEDTGWVSIRPLTVVIGPNGSGKTSLLAPFLLLKQTLESTDRSLALRTRGGLFDAGSFADAVTDQDIRRELGLAIRFSEGQKNGKETRSGRNAPLGQHAPGEVELAFTLPEGNAFPVLQRYEVRDVVGRTLVSRVRRDGGAYDLNIQLDSTEASLRAAVLEAPPVNFLFTPEPVVRVAFSERRKGKQGRLGMQIDGATGLYFSVTSYVESWIQNQLHAVSFLGPLRDHPRRVYLSVGEHPPHVGRRGELAPQIIYRQRDPELLAEVNEWMKRFAFGTRLHPQRCGKDAFSIQVETKHGGPALNLADCGFGLSQVLPLIVQGFYPKPPSLLITEQPEIHLNPRLQTVLADLFCAVAAGGRGVLVETHSEHLLLRLRRLVAEERIEAKNVSLLYVESSGPRATVREIPIRPNGHVVPEEWPKGFFEDSLRESLGLVAAQAQAGKHAR